MLAAPGVRLPAKTRRHRQQASDDAGCNDTHATTFATPSDMGKVRCVRVPQTLQWRLGLFFPSAFRVCGLRYVYGIPALCVRSAERIFRAASAHMSVMYMNKYRLETRVRERL